VILQQIDMPMLAWLAAIVADGLATGLRVHDRVWLSIFDHEPSKANLLWLDAYDTRIRTNH
jgi:hypothetical protein